MIRATKGGARLLLQPPRCAGLLRRRLCTAQKVTTANGLQYIDVIVPSGGRFATDGDDVSVHYTGRLKDGTVFGTSLDPTLRGNQIEFKNVTVVRCPALRPHTLPLRFSRCLRTSKGGIVVVRCNSGWGATK